MLTFDVWEVCLAVTNRFCGHPQPSQLYNGKDRFCGLVVGVPGYRSRGPASIPGATGFSE
jgi:hypothetical protein